MIAAKPPAEKTRLISAETQRSDVTRIARFYANLHGFGQRVQGAATRRSMDVAPTTHFSARERLSETPPHPASASLGPPLPRWGEEVFRAFAPTPIETIGVNREEPPLPSGERVAEPEPVEGGGRVRGRL